VEPRSENTKGTKNTKEGGKRLGISSIDEGALLRNGNRNAGWQDNVIHSDPHWRDASATRRWQLEMQMTSDQTSTRAARTRRWPRFVGGILALVALASSACFVVRYLQARTPRARLTLAVRRIGSLYNPSFAHPQSEKTYREARDEVRRFGVEAVPLLLEFAQSDRDLELQLGATDALGEFPEARDQIAPVLVARLSDCESFLEAGRLTRTLISIWPPDASIPRGLEAMVAAKDSCPRIHAACFILQRDPRHVGARTAIVGALADMDIGGRTVTAGQMHTALCAMRALAELDPADRAFAEPQLRSLAELDPSFTRGFTYLDMVRQEAQRVVGK
jgi:hypothetical protein